MCMVEEPIKTTSVRPAAGDDSGHAPSLSIVIPVYNSETTIQRLCETLIEGIRCCSRLEIVLVDDGSRDRSAAVCRRLHEAHPGVITAVILSRNFGEHNAVMAGLNFATGDYCVIMDDDFQNPPGEVEALLAEAARGYDVVYARYTEKQHSAWRNLGSRLHNLMATYALKKPKDLYLSSFKLISRFVVQEVIRYTGPDPYVDAIILRTTNNIGTVAVGHSARETGESGYTLRKLIGLWSNMMIAFSIYPLRIIGIYGLAVACAGVFYGGYTVLTLASGWLEDASDLDQLKASMWFLRGSILLVISIIGEYVGRMHRRLNAAPQFIVRHRLISHGPAGEAAPVVRSHSDEGS